MEDKQINKLNFRRTNKGQDGKKWKSKKPKQILIPLLDGPFVNYKEFMLAQVTESFFIS